MVKVVAIIQARLSSSRLPAKVMLDLMGKTVLERVVDRVKLAKLVDEIWIATSTNNEDDLIEELAKKINVKCYRGSLDNVINRYYETAKLAKADIIIRVTADNPLTEPTYIDEAVQLISSRQFDYISFENILVGSGIEAFSYLSFEDIVLKNELNEHNIEHVTSYYYQNEKLYNIEVKNQNFVSESIKSITIDTFEDYVKVFKIHEKLIADRIEQKSYLIEISSWKAWE